MRKGTVDFGNVKADMHVTEADETKAFLKTLSPLTPIAVVSFGTPLKALKEMMAIVAAGGAISVTIAETTFQRIIKESGNTLNQKGDERPDMIFITAARLLQML